MGPGDLTKSFVGSPVYMAPEVSLETSVSNVVGFLHLLALSLRSSTVRVSSEFLSRYSGNSRSFWLDFSTNNVSSIKSPPLQVFKVALFTHLLLPRHVQMPAYSMCRVLLFKIASLSCIIHNSNVSSEHKKSC